METTNQLLDQVKTRYGLKSDYALAAKIGMSRERISKYRNSGGALADENALKVAELLELDPAYVFASMEAQRTHNEEARAVWERLADFVKRHGVAATIVALAVAPALTPTPANAAPDKGAAGVCILCQIIRALMRARSSAGNGDRYIPRAALAS